MIELDRNSTRAARSKMPVRAYRGIVLLLVILLLAPAAYAPAQATPIQAQQQLAPTYRIFATREGLVGRMTANGHIIRERDRFVALPSWNVLSSYQGNEYQVRLTYEGRSVVAPVWDVGPWNTNDEYWRLDRPTYKDLPVGVPMAQAAYMDGYNNGQDMFGRTVNNPNGIDIADGTYWDDLGMTGNDWVLVTFLWLGRDPGPGGALEVSPSIPGEIASLPTPEPLPELQRGQQPEFELDQMPLPPLAPTAAAPATEPTATAAPTPVPQDNPIPAAGAMTLDNFNVNFYPAAVAWETGDCGLNGSHIWTYSRSDLLGSQSRAMWRPALLPGTYEVRAYIPACGTHPTTREARYVIVHDGGAELVQIDQQAAAGTWVSLGSYDFRQRSDPMVELSALSLDTGSTVHFDALSWILTDKPAPPNPASDPPTPGSIEWRDP